MSSTPTCNQEDQFHIASDAIARNQRRTLSVIILTFVVMIIEIAAGYWTGSMALLADGYHMASHVGALGISYIVYRLTQSQHLRSKLNFGTGKLLPLGGYTSALALGIMAFWMIYESFLRFFNPEVIHFKEALIVAVGGLLTNVASAFILGWKNTLDETSHAHAHETHSHGHGHDHNHESALAHVLTDALTSVFAVVALIVGGYFGLQWLDPFMGIVGAIVILFWAYGLCRKTAWELLDGSVSEINTQKIKKKIRDAGLSLHYFHLWKVGPENFICIVSIGSLDRRNHDEGAAASPRDLIRTFFPERLRLHLVVEIRET